MTVANFYHIKLKDGVRFVNDSFTCIILKNKNLSTFKEYCSKKDIYSTNEVVNQKEYLYPVATSIRNKVFVYGLGYIKANEKDLVTVPRYNTTIEGWNDYVLKYGYHCLFYSLTGYELYSTDCCILSMKREFLSFLHSNWGLEKYGQFVDIYKQINGIQLNTLKNYHLETIELRFDYLFIPQYCIGPFLVCCPSVDALIDNDKLAKLYNYKRYSELRKEGKDSLEMSRIVDEEISNGNTFPISTENRMTLLYGIECTTLYKRLLKEFD